MPERRQLLVPIHFDGSYYEVILEGVAHIVRVIYYPDRDSGRCYPRSWDDVPPNHQREIIHKIAKQK